MPWATPADLVEDSPITETKECISQEGLAGMRPVPDGTVLVNGIGAGVGKVGIAGTNMVFNQQIHALLPKRNLHISNYLMFCMIARRDEMLTLANLNTIPILNGERLGRLMLPIPDMSIQENIVTEINREGQFQRVISGKTARSISRLREYRAALITAAVTGKIDVGTYGIKGTTSATLDRIEEGMQA
jgi:type I restriction enzyme S subunit|tara:strand:+ start:150 stop:713 length:564 start_codon:yes stop_codon:yes gene_type:complete